MAGLGVLMGMFGMFELTKSLDYKVSYALASGICLLIAFFLLVGVKDGKNIEKKSYQHLALG